MEEVEAAAEEMNNSLVAQMVKNLPATWEAWVQSLGWAGFQSTGAPPCSLELE